MSVVMWQCVHHSTNNTGTQTKQHWSFPQNTTMHTPTTFGIQLFVLGFVPEEPSRDADDHHRLSSLYNTDAQYTKVYHKRTSNADAPHMHRSVIQFSTAAALACSTTTPCGVYTIYHNPGSNAAHTSWVLMLMCKDMHPCIGQEHCTSFQSSITCRAHVLR